MNNTIIHVLRKWRRVKDIDFLPVGIRTARKKRKEKLFLGLLGVLLAAGVYMLYTYPQKIIRECERELAVKNTFIHDLEKGKAVYDRLQATEAKLNTMLAALDEIEGQRFSAANLMAEIAEALPYNVSVSKLSLESSKVTLTVVSASPIDTARVVVALRRLDLFQEVEISAVPLVNEPKEITFELALKEGSCEKRSPNASFKETIQKFYMKIFPRGLSE